MAIAGVQPSKRPRYVTVLRPTHSFASAMQVSDSSWCPMLIWSLTLVNCTFVGVHYSCSGRYTPRLVWLNYMDGYAIFSLFGNRLGILNFGPTYFRTAVLPKKGDSYTYHLHHSQPTPIPYFSSRVWASDIVASGCYKHQNTDAVRN